MTKGTPGKEKQTMDIHDLHALVHQGQNKGVTVINTLKKYGVSKRAYYVGCKKNNLPSWTSKNQRTVLIKKGVKLPTNNLYGGSLITPENDKDNARVRFAKDMESIKAKKKKSRELDIKRK